MNFDLTEDQVAIRNAVGEVCADFDDDSWLRKDREGGFPEDFYRAMAKAGWLGIAMPAEYGGSGLGISEACIIMEAVSGSGAGLSGAWAIHMNVFGLHPVVVHGSDEQSRARLSVGPAAGRARRCVQAVRESWPGPRPAGQQSSTRLPPHSSARTLGQGSRRPRKAMAGSLFNLTLYASQCIIGKPGK